MDLWMNERSFFVLLHWDASIYWISFKIRRFVFFFFLNNFYLFYEKFVCVCDVHAQFREVMKYIWVNEEKASQKKLVVV